MFENILVATDGSHSAEKAVKFAVDFAQRHGSRLIITTVTRERPALAPEGACDLPDPIEATSPILRGQADQTAEILRRAEEEAKRAGVTDYEICKAYGDNTAAAIVKLAETHGADHIVVGSVGATGLTRLLLGSVAASVIHHAACPVTVVR